MRERLEKFEKMDESDILTADKDMKIHPFWYELMEYVKANGGHMKLNIRFKDGIPIEAEL